MGLIFDHGCDAFTSGAQAIMAIRALCGGNNSLSLAYVISVQASFHFATLEGYYRGSLDLPIFNGASDGSIPIILLYVVTGFVKTDYLTKSVLNNTLTPFVDIEVFSIG